MQYLYANTGQNAQVIVQIVDGYGYPCDLDGDGNWLDGYGYFVDGYYTDPPDGYYPDGYSDGYSGPNDGYYVPVIQRIIVPDRSELSHFPRPMTRLGKGLYIFGVSIPNGVPAIGAYIVSVSWMKQNLYNWETYVIQASRPFGITSVSPI